MKQQVSVDSIGFTISRLSFKDLRGFLKFYRHDSNENGIPVELKIISSIGLIGKEEIHCEDMMIERSYIPITLTCRSSFRIYIMNDNEQLYTFDQDKIDELKFGRRFSIGIGGLWPCYRLTSNQLKNKRILLHLLFHCFSEFHLSLNRIDIALDIFAPRNTVQVTPATKIHSQKTSANTQYINLRKDKSASFKIYDKSKKEECYAPAITRVELCLKSKKIRWNATSQRKHKGFQDIHLRVEEEDVNRDRFIKMLHNCFKKIEIQVLGEVITPSTKALEDSIYDIMAYCHLNTTARKLSNSDKAFMVNNENTLNIIKRFKQFCHNRSISLSPSISGSIKKRKITKKSICEVVKIDHKTLNNILDFYENH